MAPASARLTFLWISQGARVLADCCLRVFVVLHLGDGQFWGGGEAWNLVTAVAMLPAVFLAPLIGAISNSLPKPIVLSGSAAYCLGMAALFGLFGGPWLACWGLLALGSAVYGPTRDALLPAAAEDTRVPLARVNGWIEIGASTAIMAGLWLGRELHGTSWGSWEAAVVMAGALNLLAVLTAWPVRFAGDVCRPEAPGKAVAGFFGDGRRLWGDREARSCLLALAALRGLITAWLCAVLGVTVTDQGTSAFWLGNLLESGAWVLSGVALGSFLVSWQGHPRRVLGLVPYAAAGLGIGLILVAASPAPGPTLWVFLGIMGGLINVPLAATYQAALPPDARGTGMTVRYCADYLAIFAVAFFMFGLNQGEILSAAGQRWLIALLAVLAAGWSWWILLTPAMELTLAILIWPLYRVRARGPGLEHFPPRGPLLVVANHSSWFDPIWVGKVVPRRIIPLMTSVFYDLPLLRPLMVLAGVIRVQASTYRRQAPELKQAVAALDQGECVVIFPEGAMRKRASQPLRQFGQGVALILKERPQTPVILCWIEGGWGSFFSYYNGLPTKNKRFDFWRHIDIAMEAPRTIDLALLDDPRAVRKHLMQACLNARRHLGLEPLALELTAETEGMEEEEKMPDPG